MKPYPAFLYQTAYHQSRKTSSRPNLATFFLQEAYFSTQTTPLPFQIKDNKPPCLAWAPTETTRLAAGGRLWLLHIVAARVLIHSLYEPLLWLFAPAVIMAVIRGIAHVAKNVGGATVLAQATTSADWRCGSRSRGRRRLPRI